VSVAWFSRLYRLNDAGKFDEVVRASKKYLAERPKDYALHLQRAKALLSLGRLEEATQHLDSAVTNSKGLAAWPWFYRAALHARRGERKEMYRAIETTLRLDSKLAPEFLDSPFFAAHWKSATFRDAVRAPRKKPSLQKPKKSKKRTAPKRRSVRPRRRAAR
jgi:tetratricopeptide (TPR) repeat protein